MLGQRALRDGPVLTSLELCRDYAGNPVWRFFLRDCDMVCANIVI